MATVRIAPGNCNFETRVSVAKIDKRSYKVEIESACEQVSRLGEGIRELTLRDVLCPPSLSPLLEKAGECRLHASCPVPVGILKAMEVEAGLALPMDVVIRFERSAGKDDPPKKS